MRYEEPVRHNVSIRKGDQVKVVSGRDRGKTGRVLSVDPWKNTVIVEHANIVKRHTRPNPAKNVKGGIVEREGPMSVSNVMVVCQACRRGLWVYLGLPTAMDADGGPLGRLFLTDLIMALEEIQRTEGELVHAPLAIILDEFPSYALPQFARVFEQARSSGIGIILGAQTVSGLSDRAAGLSEGFRDRVLGNCAHIVSFRLGPGEGAEYFAKFTGKAAVTITVLR